MELAPGIHSLHVSMEGTFFVRRYPPNAYLVEDGECALIDSGYGDEHSINRRLEQLKELGNPRIDYIILTHPHLDHLGGAERFKELTGAKILIHHLDADVANEAFQNSRVDDAFGDGEVIRIGRIELEMVHTPGHTHGHTCVLKRDDRAIFTGDHILGTGTTAVGPERGDMAKYIESLHRLQGMELSVLYPGHGEPVLEPQRKIRELIDHRMERDRQVLMYLGRGIDTIDGLVKAIYPELDDYLLNDARGQVKVHLIKLEREGRVESRGQGQTYTLR